MVVAACGVWCGRRKTAGRLEVLGPRASFSPSALLVVSRLRAPPASTRPACLHPPRLPTPLLAGDCHFKMEAMRGNFAVRAQHQKCVRRRAELSVSMNPYCGGAAGAKRAVDAAFESCFADTAPFDRIP